MIKAQYEAREFRGWEFYSEADARGVTASDL